MGKIRVEVCLISARGLRRSSSLWKVQWFAVGWIEPDNKYCTKIDASGNANPVWKTKFAALVDDSNLKDMALQVEVYSREPIFLRERLQGTATVVLKEFLSKNSRSGAEQVGSYQLRKRNSNKPQGLVDISIRISDESEDEAPYQGGNEGQVLMDHSTGVIRLSTEGGTQTSLTGAGTGAGAAPFHHLVNANPMSYPPNFCNISPGGASYPPAPGVGPSYQPPPPPPPPRTPPPPPPPSNVGYIPTFLPRTDYFGETYVNMPSSTAAPGRGPRPGFAMGAGTGALAAGALIFGDDFMSGFDIPAGLPDASLTISTDPPF
ncbi:hypothetical protein SLEP1_g5122 [Rubroshorea leprosula]|uniref:C2 domain-containing protein n=1 Tax=Rubroshorea leprosula TaxID=152421 RepID=A0AAV5HQZ2_9ROSI|nr:hypothetical protein SLEP1_g5122 [Rubroshorea leprosula]